MMEPIPPETAQEGTTSPAEPLLRPEARVVRADRSLAAMVLVICTLGGMGVGFGFAMYLMRAQLAYAPFCGGHFAPVQLDDDSDTWLGATYNTLSRPGNLILEVHPYTAAARAGLRPGDMVMTFDGRMLHGGDLRAAVAEHDPGDLVTIGILRNRQPLVLQARLGSL